VQSNMLPLASPVKRSTPLFERLKLGAAAIDVRHLPFPRGAKLLAARCSTGTGLNPNPEDEYSDALARLQESRAGQLALAEGSGGRVGNSWRARVRANTSPGIAAASGMRLLPQGPTPVGLTILLRELENVES
jgi:hypothetical protein